MEKDSSITVRVSEKTKKKLRKMAEENRREFSDFIRLILTDIADEKIKINL
ncbi:MAG: ribbon-helix-helix protein, CopG family [Bacteroidota bacterium]